MFIIQRIATTMVTMESLRSIHQHHRWLLTHHHWFPMYQAIRRRHRRRQRYRLPYQSVLAMQTLLPRIRFKFNLNLPPPPHHHHPHITLIHLNSIQIIQNKIVAVQHQTLTAPISHRQALTSMLKQQLILSRMKLNNLEQKSQIIFNQLMEMVNVRYGPLIVQTNREMELVIVQSGKTFITVEVMVVVVVVLRRMGTYHCKQYHHHQKPMVISVKRNVQVVENMAIDINRQVLPEIMLTSQMDHRIVVEIRQQQHHRSPNKVSKHLTC